MTEDEPGELFGVVWAADGRRVADADLKAIAIDEKWARTLVWSDMAGFAVESDGTLILLDKCGNYAHAPPRLFTVEWTKAGTEQ
jgi:hypothetical protein